MNNIKTIFCKEIRRFFTEPRMLAALFLPGILIFLLYTLMGSLIESEFASSSGMPTNYTYKIAATDNYGENPAPLIFDVFGSYVETSEKTNTFEPTFIKSEEVNEYKEKLLNNEYDLLIVFDDDFETSLISSSGEKCNISLFYNGANEVSTYTYNLFSSLVDSTYTRFTVNIENGIYVNANVSNEDYALKSIMSFIVPLVTIALLFSAVISICPEAIAGEKERGTLALLLMTPIKRSEIAIGKISALTITSLASGIVSFLGLVISLPSLIGGDISVASLFSPATFIMLLLLIITTLIVFTSIGLVISTFSKSIKEAGSYLTPIMTILMIAAIIPFSVDMTNIGFAFIPLLNIVSSMNLLITESNFVAILPYISITVVTNIILSALFIFLTAKMFNSERIMFQS